MVVKFHRQRRALQLAYLYIDHLLDLYLDAGGLDEDQLGKLGQQIHQQLLTYIDAHVRTNLYGRT